MNDVPGGAVGQVTLKPRKAQPFFGRHPWVLDSAIASLPAQSADGEVVDLLSDRGEFIARGIVNRRSRIRVRLYSWDADQPLDEPFWRGRLREAIRLRRLWDSDAADAACRLVFGEADGLSGLVVDRYGPHLVMQIGALAIQRRQAMFLELLRAELQPESITVRGERGVVELEGMERADRTTVGNPPHGPVVIVEHGLKYRVDLEHGQKTGYYLDQRQNRLAAARYFAGRDVLDVFCYTGGFSLAAARLGGARSVLGIDSSERALELARSNAELNGVAGVTFEKADAFRRLEQLRGEGRTFDAVVLDPPRFTRSRQKIDEALRGYMHINRLAVDLLRPDGLLVTCSCTGNVLREDLLHVLANVAQRTGRAIQVLEQRGAAPDHPVSAWCLETDYLKCFICAVR